jgi:hypothetical protein
MLTYIRITATIWLLISGLTSMPGLASAKEPLKKVTVESNQVSSDALALAMHLMRPEVIGTCLKEIKESKYDFVWTEVTSKEERKPTINVTYRLKATLVDSAKNSATDQIAILTVSRDLEKLKSGKLHFNCNISYEAKK